jgi:endonuclease/exonuclease/phosphatase family metal-dependent hydrolase
MLDALMMLAAALATPTAPAQPVAPNDLSVMSYNVHGLPWPIALGRARELHRIGQRLEEMRRDESQPHIVLLQEAFSSEAKAIAREAGYPVVVSGPGRSDRFDPALDGQEKQFARADDKLKGEGDGKFEDSGLLILSDYPVLDVQRVPYAGFACAGFDCLANKGIVMVRVLVPGTSQPLTVIDTHLNSRRASGVGISRANAAFGWQAEQLRAFVGGKVPANSPVIVAGDFNVGKDPYRRAMISGPCVLPGSDDALGSALEKNPSFADRSATQAIVIRGKDLMFARSGISTRLTLQSITVPFGREKNGKSLSDHFGYVAHYSIADAAPQL